MTGLEWAATVVTTLAWPVALIVSAWIIRREIDRQEML